MLAAQQVIVDGVLFGDASIIQADDDGQPEHGDERSVFRHPVQLFHGGGVTHFRSLGYIIYIRHTNSGGRADFMPETRHVRIYNNVSFLLFRDYIGAAVVDARLVMRKLASRLTRTSSYRLNLRTSRLVCRDAAPA